MAIFDNFSGIPVASGFKLQSKSPLDPRAVVDTIDDRNALITENGAYEGMIVYVKADKKTYCLKSLIEKNPFKVGDALPDKIYYDTSITPDIKVNGMLILCDDARAAEDSTIDPSYFIANIIEDDVVGIYFYNADGIVILYADSETKTVEEINAMLMGFGVSITKKGWQGNGVLNAGYSVGKRVDLVNNPQGIFYKDKGDPIWEEVGAGGAATRLTREIPQSGWTDNSATVELGLIAKSVKIYPTNASAAEYLRCGVVCTKLEHTEHDTVLTMECEEIPTKNIEIIIEVIF